MSDKENCSDVPLIELLQRVPEDASAWYEHDSTHHSHIPYGNYCHRAVQRIKELEAALGFYADKCTYPLIFNGVSKIEDDLGSKARQALNKPEKK